MIICGLVIFLKLTPIRELNNVRPAIMFGLIWFQTVCNDCQQMILAGIDLKINLAFK